MEFSQPSTSEASGQKPSNLKKRTAPKAIRVERINYTYKGKVKASDMCIDAMIDDVWHFYTFQ